VRISPKARPLAREHGDDINTLRVSGPSGEILADDILKASKSSPPEGGAHASTTATGGPAPAAAGSGFSRTEDLSSIGRIMAERTTQSWTTVPHFFVSRDVDATTLNAARERMVPTIERSHGVKVTHTDLMVAAVARALRQHARMNASWSDGGVTVHADVNIALAMAVDNAVVTAVLRNADRLSLGELAKQRRELADRARANRLQPADIAGATFTISNLGMFGVDAFTAIIVPPQAGILAVGAITDRVVAVDGLIGVRPMMTLTLSSDHRVVDGARAAAFLNDVVLGLAEINKWL
jgi:pyruvate dehydrogenase E2 component (dihydrolipoamide acetyltransferase)